MWDKPIYLKAMLLLTSACTLTVAPMAASTPDDAQLARLEQKLFFTTYSNDDEEARVTRLEKSVFGQKMPGDLKKRLAAVAGALPAKGNEGQENAQNIGAPANQNARGFTQGASQESGTEKQEAGLERAQLAVQAAREKESRRLSSEGVELWRNKKGREALTLFQQSIMLDPQNAEARFSMGIIYESMGDLSEALSCYKSALNTKPDNQDYQEAVKTLQTKMNGREPGGEVDQLAADAAAAYKRGEWLTALDLYKQLDEKSPNQAAVKYNIGTLYLNKGDAYMALKYYQQAAALKPQEPKFVEAYQRLQASAGRSGASSGEVQLPVKPSFPMLGRQMPAPPPNLNYQQPPNQPPPYYYNPNQTMPMTPMMPATGDKHQKKAKMNMAPPPSAMASLLGLTGSATKYGVKVTEVAIASRAARVGIAKGDMIKAVDGSVVNTPDDINRILMQKMPGAPVQLFMQRNKQMGQVNL